MFTEQKNDMHENEAGRPNLRLGSHTSRAIRLLIIAMGAALFTQTAAMAQKIVFSEGHWVGQKMTDVARPGCMMAMQLDDDTALAIFATAAGDFDLAFSSKTWNIDEADGDVKANLEIDGEPVMFTRVFVPVPSTIVIRAQTPSDTRKLENLIRKAEDMNVEFVRLNYSAHTSFFDNHLAVTALKNCVKAAEREAKASR